MRLIGRLIGFGAAAVLTYSLFGCGNNTAPRQKGLDTVQAETVGQYMSIPYEQHLKIRSYEGRRLRDLQTRETDRVLAVAKATIGYDEGPGSDSIPYTIVLTGLGNMDEKQVLNNLSACNVWVIPKYEYRNDGNMTDTVRVVTYQGQLVLEGPASRFKCSDIEKYAIDTEMKEKKGKVTSEGVHRLWLPENQQLEKPCIPDDPYVSPCTQSRPAQPSASPRPTPHRPAQPTQCPPCPPAK